MWAAFWNSGKMEPKIWQLMRLPVGFPRTNSLGTRKNELRMNGRR
jgi:hypothetical protein